MLKRIVLLCCVLKQLALLSATTSSHAEAAITKGATGLPQHYFLGSAAQVAASQSAPAQPSLPQSALTKDDPSLRALHARRGIAEFT